MSKRYIMRDSVWGASVAWWNTDIGRIHGHLTPMINVGDEVVSGMDSGNDAVFKVISVEQMQDPSDQFFADVQFVGYLKDIDNLPADINSSDTPGDAGE